MNKTHIDEGFYSLYKGSTFAITGAAAKACLTLPIYNLFKRKFSSEKDSTFNKFMQRVGVSMISGILISALLYPFDSLKRISQLNGGRAAQKLYKSDAEIGLKVPKTIRN